ncbi:hypothetical protein TanjilG_19181 [Lupinus angustifolius]|uniref:PB1 domain-containing protein n=1 Tax=Lupinus angustifolius TaxID=3871 RepID=A0A4P1RRK6_LUPAN|nr:PREDICTED: protein NLP2-like [Lupinus angustifolius]OIW16465.1 hypothetical protein TanjilG_19181 [Lupinus angustifolius]
MEYDALVNNNSGLFGSLSSSVDTDEAIDLTDELLVEGCWVETTTGGGDHIHQLHQDIELLNGGSLVGKRWWIEPSTTTSSLSSSVKERLVVAVGYLKEYTKNTNILIQIWVPQRSNSRLPPFEFNHDHLVTPTNVKFFRNQQVHHQLQQYDVRGCLTLPVFQRGTATCLGVLQITTTTNHNSSPFTTYHRPQQLIHNNLSLPLDHAVVDFRSCQNLIPTSSVKVYDDELYQAALNEIVEVLTSVCKTHNLPLALTWAPCIQQGKYGCGHSATDQNYVYCVSTVDSACFVVDLDILGFQEACSQYHLYRGQGIVGTAFTTAKPCFAIDITAFSKAEYPLSHHANMFGLHAAFAIPLRSLYTASADFVLEFFLPKDCHDPEEQRHMLNSLSMLVQQGCRSLHVVTEDEFTLPLPSPPPPPPPPHNKEEAHMIEKLLFASTLSSSQVESSSWIAHMMEAQQKGKGVSVSLEYELEEPKEEFKVTTNWDGSNELIQAQTTQVFSEFTEQSSGSRSRASTVEVGTGGGEECYSFSGRHSSTTTTTTTNSGGGGRKTGDKRRTKAEKTISLPVLRQYFAGSLKDAAKSIGVCPTTLKRICRQHGITRWPSRKIKKVGHSLKKLQLVIDSVQGAEGAIQIGSFYTSFPELCSDSSNKMHTEYDNNNNNNNNNGFYNGDVCSQNFAASSMINNTNNNGGVDVLMMTESSPDHHHDHAFVNRELSIQEDTKLYFTRSKAAPSGWRGALRVKATFLDEKIRFSLQPKWGFRELQVEIRKRLNLNDVRNIDLKYLDDEGEWVVLACDGDLEECKDLHRSSQGRTIRLSLFQASPVHNNNNNLSNTFSGGRSTTPSSSS